MQKKILITGATDGIGLETAKLLLSKGHKLLLHGRNPEKLNDVTKSLSRLSAELSKGEVIETYVADLSRMTEVNELSEGIVSRYTHFDVLINNAGIFKSATSITPEQLDVRFAVNTIAPYLLTKKFLPLLGASGRVVNLSSAAQAPVDLEILAGKKQSSDQFNVYAQSKLALTMWSFYMAHQLGNATPAIISVNPGSMLGSKMVKEGFGVAGGDLSKGAEIIARAALSEEFAAASGQYFDNDSGHFSSPHVDVFSEIIVEKVIHELDRIVAKYY